MEHSSIKILHKSFSKATKSITTANVPLRVLIAETKKKITNQQGQNVRLSTSAGAAQTNTGEYNYVPTTSMADELNKTETKLQIEEDEDEDEGVVKLADMDENVPLSGGAEQLSRQDEMFSGFAAPAKAVHANPSSIITDSLAY